MIKTKKIKSTKWLVWFWNSTLAIVVVGLIFFLGTGVKNNFPLVWSSFAKPFITIGDWVAGFGKSVKSFNQLNVGDQALIKEIAQLSVVESEITRLESENFFLRSQLGLENKVNFIPFVAHIFNRDSSGFVDFLNISLGSIHGVEENMNVLGLDRVLVGRVGQVHKKSSQVILLSDPLSRVSAKTKDGTSGIVIGQLNSGLVFDLIPKDRLIKPGDLVVSSGLDGIYIPDLPIGRVRKVINVNSGLYQQALIEPLAEYNQLNEVLVIGSLQ